MKICLRILLLSFSICIISCGGDDLLSTSIVGSSWELKSISQTTCDDPDNNVAIVSVENNCLEWQSDEFCNFILKFFENGEGRSEALIDGELDIDDFTYTTDDNNNQITYCNSSNDCDIGIVQENQLTLLIQDGNSCTINVVFAKM